MPSMGKPSAGDFYFGNVIPRFSTHSYEEYVLQTSLAKGRAKAPLNDDLLSYYRNHALAALQYSNSIEIDYVYRNIVESDPTLSAFCSQCFVDVSNETDIYATAVYASTSYSGRIIKIDPGLPIRLEFFLAPFVTLSWALDSETPARIKDELEGPRCHDRPSTAPCVAPPPIGYCRPWAWPPRNVILYAPSRWFSMKSRT